MSGGGNDIATRPLTLTEGRIRAAAVRLLHVSDIHFSAPDVDHGHFRDLAPSDQGEWTYTAAEGLAPSIFAVCGNHDSWWPADSSHADRFMWLFQTKESQRRRLEAGMKLIREALSKLTRADARRALRASLKAETWSAGSVDDLNEKYRPRRPVYTFLVGLITIFGRRNTKPRPSLAKAGGRSDFLCTVRPVEYVPAEAEHELFNNRVFPRVVENCRAVYLKFLSWKVSFVRTEVITLIRRLDFRGMASIKEGLFEALSPSIQIWSDYGTDQRRRSGLCACPC